MQATTSAERLPAHMLASVNEATCAVNVVCLQATLATGLGPLELQQRLPLASTTP